ncbi:hypothetical protein [Microbacterium sp. WCS2018Hpa-9]|uniref:hypothetical protein n=1 Tax=Microbacterium sp. WCS2018Hpa-9 TaxID=3073635 RepID=UPI00288ADD2B|nr:hypothetical protein [Microbacterium sp. WCS2018Hpa-9]
MWFKVDDRLHASRKVRRIPRAIRLEAMGLWVISGSWAAGEGLDGFVPEYMIEEFGGRAKLVDALITAGLWVEAAEGTAFHAWTEYNPDAETVQAGREAKAEGAKHGNHKRWHVKRRTKVPGCEWCFPDQLSDLDQITDGELIGSPSSTDGEANPPDPTRPDPIKNKDFAHPSGSPSAQMINRMFDDFWRAWPVKKGKEPARKSFVKAIKSGADIKAIMAGVEAYKAELGPIMGGKTVDGRTPKYAQGWLTDRRWEDEPASASIGSINAQWDAALADHRPDPCANGHKWAADGSCVRYPCAARKDEEEANV